MKIVFICNEYPPAMAGGIGTFTRGLGEALAHRGCDVYVVGCFDVRAPQRDCVNGVHVVRLPATKGISGIVANRTALFKALCRISELGAIDVIEAPDFEGSTAGLPRRSKLRVVRLHGSHRYFSDESNVRHSSSIGVMEKIALLQADAILSVSDYTARRTRDLFGLSADVITVHNAVNVPAHWPRKVDYHERKNAVYFGTLTRKKGVLALAEAWRRFHLSHPDWRLTVIGRDYVGVGGSTKEAMEDLLKEARESVEFTGYLASENILSRLAKFDFAVLPSFSEAFALAPMEAMAFGLPVIYSSMSSGPELIEDGVDGWLCDPRSIESVERALTRAAESMEERRRVGRNARVTIEDRFSYEAFVDRNVQLYEALLAGSSLVQ